jgi:hypothetical protein
MDERDWSNETKLNRMIPLLVRNKSKYLELRDQLAAFAALCLQCMYTIMHVHIHVLQTSALY